MNSVAELEQQILALPAADRERLAAAVWESLVRDPAAAADPAIDPDGINFAVARDAELSAGNVEALSHDDFMTLTGGGPPE